MSAVASARTASWGERGATLAVFIAVGLVVGGWAAAIPTLRSDLGLDAARLSLVLLVIPVACVTATTAMGFVVPLVGSGRATAWSSLAMVLSFALPGLVSSYGQLLAAAAVIGLAAGSIEVAVNGHASDIESRWGAAIMSSFHAGFSFGGLAGALLGALATWAGAGLQGQLWLPVGVAAALTAGAIPALGRGVRHEREAGGGFRWPERQLMVLCVIALLGYLVEGAIADWSGVYLATEAGAPAWFTAIGYAAFSITMTAGRLSGDWVVGRLGPQRVLMLGSLVEAAGLALAILVPAPWPVAVGFALVGIGAANIVPVVISAAGRSAASPAAGVAAVTTFGFAGFLGGPPMIGALATWAGLRAGLAAVMVATLLVAIASVLLGSEPQPSRRRSRT